MPAATSPEPMSPYIDRRAPPKASHVQIGAIVALVIFAVGVIFNSGVTFSQVSTLSKAVEDDHATMRRIEDAQAETNRQQAIQNGQTNVSLDHITTLVEQMRATQELKATGAMH